MDGELLLAFVIGERELVSLLVKGGVANAYLVSIDREALLLAGVHVARVVAARVLGKRCGECGVRVDFDLALVRTRLGKHRRKPARGPVELGVLGIPRVALDTGDHKDSNQSNNHEKDDLALATLLSPGHPTARRCPGPACAIGLLPLHGCPFLVFELGSIGLRNC